MRKGEQTRAAILNSAVGLAARQGLEGITIGTLADSMHMSKSGVFAHFGSREDLQIAVLREYERRFVEDVLKPGLLASRGLPRLIGIFECWLHNTTVEDSHGCIWISGAAEYDDRPGPVRDALVSIVRSWQREITKAITQAVEEEHLSLGAGDPAETGAMISDLVFDLYGVILALHHDARLLKSPDALARARRAFKRAILSRTSEHVTPLERQRMFSVAPHKSGAPGKPSPSVFQ